MVFTHLPSNVLLLACALHAVVQPAGRRPLLLRHVLSQMDVPTRQAYTMALVAPEERPAAAGLTGAPAPWPRPARPVVSGVTHGAAAATGSRSSSAGGLKIVYDLALFFRFRRVKLPEGA